MRPRKTVSQLLQDLEVAPRGRRVRLLQAIRLRNPTIADHAAAVLLAIDNLPGLKATLARRAKRLASKRGRRPPTR